MKRTTVIASGTCLAIAAMLLSIRTCGPGTSKSFENGGVKTNEKPPASPSPLPAATIVNNGSGNNRKSETGFHGLTKEEATALKNLPEFLDQEDNAMQEALAPLRKWAEADPAACLVWTLENLHGEPRQRCLEEAVGLWSLKSPAEALDWLGQREDQEGIEGAVSAALAELALRNGAAAASWLEKHPSQASRDNLEILVDRWAETQPAEVFVWVGQNLDDGMRAALLPHLLAALRSPEATESLLKTAAAPDRDQALIDAIASVSHASPAFALDLARRIDDLKLRQRETEKILSERARED